MVVGSKSKKNYLTREGYENLAQELHDIKTSKLPNILERLGEAKALGDLSENFEYKTALEDKDFLESRMGEIESLIANVEILESEKKDKKGQKGVVDFGSVVSLKFEDDDEVQVVTIVGTGETDIDADDVLKVSFDSPIGSAIKGKSKGDIVRVRLQGGRKELKIIDVK